MTTTRRQRTWTRTGFVLALAASSVALFALGAGAASAARMTTCANQVINDWLQHEPDVEGTYPLKCYRQAIQALESYPDIQQYSNAPGDIRRALQAAKLHQKDSGGPTGTTGGSSAGPTGGIGGGNGGDNNGPGGGSGVTPGGAPPSGGAGPDKSFITRVFDAVGPGNAQSIPLPLLVLAGLAVLLLLAAAGTWIARRVQARRMTPARAPVPRER